MDWFVVIIGFGASLALMTLSHFLYWLYRHWKEFDVLLKKWNSEWERQRRRGLRDDNDAKQTSEMLKRVHSELSDWSAENTDLTPAQTDQIKSLMNELAGLEGEFDAAGRLGTSGLRTDVWERGTKIFNQLKDAVDEILIGQKEN